MTPARVARLDSDLRVDNGHDLDDRETSIEAQSLERGQMGEPRALRVLIIATEKGPIQGGVARTVEYLRAGLAARGHLVDIWAYPDVPRLHIGQVRVSGMPLRLPALLSKLSGYDILHVHGATPTLSDVVLAAVRLRRKRPVVVYTHHNELDFGPGPLKNAYNRLHRRLSAVADETVCTSLGAVAAFGDLRRASVIPLGVDPVRFRTESKPSEPFTVLFVGQLRAYKGVPILMNALARVYGVKLLIAGSGPKEKALRSLARALGLDVEFHIGIDDADLAGLYQRAHAIVLPATSKMEAYGLALLEGMAAGCVPIASDLPGVREVVGRIGFTFQPGAVDELAHRLRQLRDDPKLVGWIANRARSRALRYQHDRMISDYERLFLDLMAAHEFKGELESGVEVGTGLRSFLAKLAVRLGADSIEVAVSNGHGPAQMASLTYPGGHSTPETEVIKRYALASAEPVRLHAENVPLLLRGKLQGWQGAALSAPLITNRAAFGALTATRARPFDESDSLAWTRISRHLAPLLGPHLAAGPLNTPQG